MAIVLNLKSVAAYMKESSILLIISSTRQLNVNYAHAKKENLTAKRLMVVTLTVDMVNGHPGKAVQSLVEEESKQGADLPTSQLRKVLVQNVRSLWLNSRYAMRNLVRPAELENTSEWSILRARLSTELSALHVIVGKMQKLFVRILKMLQLMVGTHHGANGASVTRVVEEAKGCEPGSATILHRSAAEISAKSWRMKWAPAMNRTALKPVHQAPCLHCVAPMKDMWI